MKTELRNSVLQLARLLQELKGEDTIAVRLEPSVSWASYCIISTCNSVTHMHGILGRLRKELIFEDSELRWNVCALSRQLEYTSWFPIDLGLIVIHLMSYDAREFYELEKLWPVAEIVGGSLPAQGRPVLGYAPPDEWLWLQVLDAVYQQAKL